MQQMQINFAKSNEILKIRKIKRNNKICETENSKFLCEKSQFLLENEREES